MNGAASVCTIGRGCTSTAHGRSRSGEEVACSADGEIIAVLMGQPAMQMDKKNCNLKSKFHIESNQ